MITSFEGYNLSEPNVGILQKLASGEDPFKAFHDAADAAEAGAVATKTMLAQVLYNKRLTPFLRFIYSLFVFLSQDINQWC